MEERTVLDGKQVIECNGSTEEKWLTFWLDNQLFGVSIKAVEQIVSMQPITEMPDYPAYAKGIISLRGNILPLIDLRMRLGKPEAAYNDRTCIIIHQMETGNVGFIVDEVDAVLDITHDKIAPAPQIGEDAANQYLAGVARLSLDNGKSEKIILCLDAVRILQEDEFYALRNAADKEKTAL